ncbi:D-alanyl-D-alanine carboxypeptidase [Mesorhizobium sp. L-8-3]|uniref:D-alanyl-D-alanine carboxypeptidase n=1 Tax=Mesorhizobium sp. L-8-3 TaxID=2744522 RepID=UPI001935244A|nr:D-alanyl-D-alanine carboxypeptidase [Mesorhizobium sp. L-8-3]BCH24903.1 D-alanyl-D-alanine carboxypeptidase [Mesorhizobium sp. L-8-3]
MRQASLVRHLPRSPISLKPFLALLLAATLGLGASEAAAANSRYAAIVVDANTGKTLFSANADAQRYPASLTKMMTLYLIFEGLQSGKITKNTRVPFSASAAAKPPTKLGVKAGSSVTVETIVYALVTKSANDAAAAIAEYLGGSEENFARIMTNKARRLGMSDTTFRNASGLPNSAQHSTARDLAVLGIALREHFPQYYSYFSTRSFTFGRQRMGNHNKLLGRVQGVDGIKTGYTNASGFNLVSSVKSGDRKIVAVVMGGASGRARDNHMAELIKKYLPKASGRDGGDLVARAEPADLRPQITADNAATAVAAAVLPKRNAPTPDSRPELAVELATAEVEAPKASGKSVKVVTEVASVEQGYAEVAPTPAALDAVQTASTQPSGWVVQIASSPSDAEAKAALAKVSKQAPTILADASGFTSTFDKGGITYYRARFGGFATKTAAWDACGALKKKKIACYAVQQ